MNTLYLIGVGTQGRRSVDSLPIGVTSTRRVISNCLVVIITARVKSRALVLSGFTRFVCLMMNCFPLQTM
jgi:hypothetical protein